MPLTERLAVSHNNDPGVNPAAQEPRRIKIINDATTVIDGQPIEPLPDFSQSLFSLLLDFPQIDLPTQNIGAHIGPERTRVHVPRSIAGLESALVRRGVNTEGLILRTGPKTAMTYRLAATVERINLAEGEEDPDLEVVKKQREEMCKRHLVGIIDGRMMLDGRFFYLHLQSKVALLYMARRPGEPVASTDIKRDEADFESEFGLEVRHIERGLKIRGFNIDGLFIKTGKGKLARIALMARVVWADESQASEATVEPEPFEDDVEIDRNEIRINGRLIRLAKQPMRVFLYLAGKAGIPIPSEELEDKLMPQNKIKQIGRYFKQLFEELAKQGVDPERLIKKEGENRLRTYTLRAKVVIKEHEPVLTPKHEIEKIGAELVIDGRVKCTRKDGDFLDCLHKHAGQAMLATEVHRAVLPNSKETVGSHYRSMGIRLDRQGIPIAELAIQDLSGNKTTYMLNPNVIYRQTLPEPQISESRPPLIIFPINDSRISFVEAAKLKAAQQQAPAISSSDQINAPIIPEFELQALPTHRAFQERVEGEASIPASDAIRALLGFIKGDAGRHYYSEIQHLEMQFPSSGAAIASAAKNSREPSEAEKAKMLHTLEKLKALRESGQEVPAVVAGVLKFLGFLEGQMRQGIPEPLQPIWKVEDVSILELVELHLGGGKKEEKAELTSTDK